MCGGLWGEGGRGQEHRRLFCFHFSPPTHHPPLPHSSCRVCLEKHNHKRRRRRANRNSGSGGGDGGDGGGGSGSGGPSHQGTPPPRRFKRTRAGDSDADDALIRGVGTAALEDAGGIMVGVGVVGGEAGEAGVAGAQADVRLSERYVDPPPKRKAAVRAEALWQALDADAHEFEDEEPTPKRAKQGAAKAVREEVGGDEDDDDDDAATSDEDDHPTAVTPTDAAYRAGQFATLELENESAWEDGLHMFRDTPRGPPDAVTPRAAATTLPVTPRVVFDPEVPPADKFSLIHSELAGAEAVGELLGFWVAPAAESGLGCW